MQKYKQPLGRTIAIGIVVFTIILCLMLSILNYYNQKDVMYGNYEDYISDILRYVKKNIDDEDLQVCIETVEESEKYKETLLFMDSMMNEFNLHYLYVLQPRVSDDGKYTVFSVLSAEDDYGRYVTLDDNLWLGYETGEEDGYDQETVEGLIEIMNQDEIVFFAETTTWGTDYTGAMALKDADGKGYAVLAADVDITVLNQELRSQALRNFLTIIILGMAYMVTFMWWIKRNVTGPIRMLEKGVVDFASRSHGQRDINELKIDVPDIKANNEVGALSKSIIQMTNDMQDYVLDILSAEEQSKNMKNFADTMRALAIVDSLTGIRNKTAYDREIEKMTEEMQQNNNYNFGMCMVDLNYLKLINDTYGHKKGDEAIKLLSDIICSIFAHSPVFRVGGDEFVIILRGQDFNNYHGLLAEFLASTSNQLEKEPWKHVSAAIGTAFYDKKTDKTIDDVLKRADANMYEMKKQMHATREDS